MATGMRTGMETAMEHADAGIIFVSRQRRGWDGNTDTDSHLAFPGKPREERNGGSTIHSAQRDRKPAVYHHSALAARFNHFGIYSMPVWVLVENPYRRFYEKLNGMLLRNHRMPFGGEVIDVAAYGWLDTSLIYYQR